MQSKLPIGCVAAVLAAAAATAQSHVVVPTTFAPATQELDDRTPYPITTDGTRTQVFYGPAEVGAAAFTATGLALRYDGPLPPTAPGRLFTMQRFVIRVGSSDVATPGSEFAANLSAPLVTVFDGPHTFQIDQRAVSGPEPWDPTLTFRFPTPVRHDPNTHRWLVVEFETSGNAAAGAGHGSLDAVAIPGGGSGGRHGSGGSGCASAPGAPPASIRVAGSRPFAGRFDALAPGNAYWVWATGLAPNQACVVFTSLDRTRGPGGVPLPLRLPGTVCDVLTGSEFGRTAAADVTGTLLPFGDAAAVPIPADPALAGLTLHHQVAGLAPNANPLGVVTTDRLDVTLGSFAPPTRDIWMVANHQSRTAAFASEIQSAALAIRFDLQ